MEILLATGNKNKFREISHVAKQYEINLISPEVAKEKYNLGPEPEFEESFPTYQGNAELKAKEYFKWSSIPTIGDDSGLEVDALDGAPGVLSARYGGEGLTDQDRMHFLLEELKRVGALSPKERKCRYICNLVFYSGNENILSESYLEGEVLLDFKGEGGFGYDPIVYIPRIGQTLAEVDPAWTLKNGFRVLASKDIFSKILEIKA